MGVEERIVREEDEEFDYQAEKLAIRALYEVWRGDEELCQKSIALLGSFKGETSPASASLCE